MIEYTYDPLGRVIEEDWVGQSHTTTWYYDTASQLRAVEDPAASYEYQYDEAGNLVRARMAPGELVHPSEPDTTDDAELDSGTSDWDGDGVAEPYYIDSLANLLADLQIGDLVRLFVESTEFDPVLIVQTPSTDWIIDDDSGGGTDALLEFTYSEQGTWLVIVTCAEVPDPEDRTFTLEATKNPYPHGHFPYVDTALAQFDYEYDATGNLREVTDSESGKTQYDYDALHRMIQVKQSVNDTVNKRADFDYNDASQLTEIVRYADDEPTPTHVATTDYSAYDGIGRLTALSHTYDTTQLDYTWTYDAAGRITGMSLPDGDAEFLHDATDQLLTADYDEEWQDNEGYTYDDNGNRTNLGYETGDANQLVTDGHYRYEYDAEGNRTLRFVDEDESEHLNSGDTDITTFAWDHRNRLVGVSHYATEAAYGSSSPDQVVEYTYDYLDRRIARTLDSDGDGTVDEYTYQLHRGDELALEISDEDGLGGGAAPLFAHRYLYGAAVDQILAVENASGDVLWGLADHEGTIRDVVQHDGQDTVLANHVQYDSFGNPTESTAPIADFLFAFTGRPLDPDTGLYDYRARWYDPQVGRFLTEDPAGLAADPNLYRYCGNSPVMNVDPWGLCFTGVMSAIKSALGTAFQDTFSTASRVVTSATSSVWNSLSPSTGTIGLGLPSLQALSATTVQPLVMPRAVPAPGASRSIEIPVSGTGLSGPVIPTVATPTSPTAAFLGSLWSDALAAGSRVGEALDITAGGLWALATSPEARAEVGPAYVETRVEPLADRYYNVSKAFGYTDEQIGDNNSFALGPAVIGDMVQTNQVGEAWAGWDIGLERELTGVEQGQRVATAISGWTGTAAAATVQVARTFPSVGAQMYSPSRVVWAADGVGLADDVLKYSSNVTSKTGYTDVFIHGTPSSFKVLHGGKWVSLSHREVAGFLKSKGVTGNVRLISCNTGQSGLAQNLANKLGVTVQAPTTKVGIPTRFKSAPLLEKGGEWIQFTPGRKP